VADLFQERQKNSLTRGELREEIEYLKPRGIAFQEVTGTPDVKAGGRREVRRDARLTLQ